MQHRRIFFLFVCSILFGWNVLFFQPGCGTTTTQEDIICQSDLDCPGRKVCQKKRCTYQKVRTEHKKSEPVTDKNTVEAQIEQTPDEAQEIEQTTKEENPSIIPDDAGTPEPEPKSEWLPEPTSERLSEPTPEPIPEPKPEQIPEPICRNGAKKPCTHPCGKGIQLCNANAWGKCIPVATTRSCGSDKGECKAGKQTCTNGKWGACIGEVKPSKEICDNKDNDCNGKTDEVGCVCLNGKTQPCGTDKGECKKGTQTCSNGKWGSCVGFVTPSKEICDNKDNDCDGFVDEDFPSKGRLCSVGRGSCIRSGKYICKTDKTGTFCPVKAGSPTTEVCDGKDNDCDGFVDESLAKLCYPIGAAGCTYTSILRRYTCRGICSAGKQTCYKGKWLSCRSYILPQSEQCRNRKDDNCNGQVDEICGTQWPHLVVDYKGNTIPYKKPSPVTLARTGVYKLPAFYKKSCLSSPLILTANNTSMTPISYSCSSKYEYQVVTGAARTTTGSYGNTGFSVLALQRSRYEVWGLVDYKSCSSTSPYKCLQASANNPATVTKVRTGTYLLSHPNCSTFNRPYFSTLYTNFVAGYTTMTYYKKGYCRVYTYDLKGNLADRSFVYWIPSVESFAWATFNSSGKMMGLNNFKQKTAGWKATYTTGKYIDLTYDGFAKPSAVFATSQSSGYHPIVYPLYSGIKSVKIIPVRFSGTFQLHYFSILFMQ